MKKEELDRELAEEAKLKKDTDRTLWAAGAAIVGLPFLYFLWWWALADRPKNWTDPGAWGTFGDYVGGILNPLVAFLALLWLTRSIKMQRTELRETRVALSEQSKTFDKQRFEDTFFALLDQHNNVLDRLHDLRSSPVGGQAYSEINRIHQYVFSGNVSLPKTRENFMKSDVVTGHYFRILYQIFKFIATDAPESTLGGEFNETNIATPPSDEEKRYANIARAFLSTQMTQLLAVNCYCTSPASTYWALLKTPARGADHRQRRSQRLTRGAAA